MPTSRNAMGLRPPIVVPALAIALCCIGPVSTAAPTPAIVGGQASAQWPGVGVVTDGSSICTGTAITARWVLTAAHCVAGIGVGALYFLAGDNIFSSYTTIAIDQAIVHPAYNAGTFANDVALLHVKDGDLPYFAFKLDVRAPGAGFVGSNLWVMGYGLTSAAASDFGYKRLATVRVDSVDSNFFYSSYASTSSGTCSGDSGAPAFSNDSDGFPMIRGVSSFGDQFCNLTSAFVRMDSVQSFVTSTAIGVCLNGQSCDGIFRNGLEPPL